MSSRDNLIPAIGDVLMGRYRIESFIARGGMGVVMRARQLSMDREVAIKMILPQYAENEKTLARFDREVHLAKQLRHPNIVELYDYGSTEAGVLYLVMEFLEGEDLKTLLRRDGPMPIGRAGKIALQVLDALAEAHSRDIVHRDLKPSNIFVTQMRRLGDFAKLLDFGIAKSLAEDASEVTAQGEICGTSSYMAPEMFVQGTVGTTVDVYAMGLILLEMLLGKKVFAGQSSAETLVLHLRKDVTIPPPFTATHLSQVLLKSLEKHPRNRFANAVEFVEALEPALDSLDGSMQVAPETIATYDQDLADDPGLLDQVLAGPWASGMTEPESGSSDIVVVPGSQEDDPPEFEAAVTQLMEKARADFVREEEESEAIDAGAAVKKASDEDAPDPQRGVEVATRHQIPTPSAQQVDDFPGFEFDHDDLEEIDPGPPVEDPGATQKLEPGAPFEESAPDPSMEEPDPGGSYEEQSLEEPSDASSVEPSTSSDRAKTIPMQTVPHTSTMTSVDRRPVWKRPRVLAAFVFGCVAVFAVALAVTVLPGQRSDSTVSTGASAQPEAEAAEPATAKAVESPGSSPMQRETDTRVAESTADDDTSTGEDDGSPDDGEPAAPGEDHDPSAQEPALVEKEPARFDEESAKKPATDREPDDRASQAIPAKPVDGAKNSEDNQTNGGKRPKEKETKSATDTTDTESSESEKEGSKKKKTKSPAKMPSIEVPKFD